MSKKIPLRQCVGCGEMADKRDMMRVVKTPEDNITLDFRGKMNGRGAYICKKEECLEKAIKNKGLERSLKVGIPDEVKERLKEEFKLGK